ncbi:hypothetical protein PENSPDRAFT_653205 [Peniophora sp. CONT]|nr:hypothetical protein PENSPDRAFT_653205 [Peniophora sp. CONT]
MGPEGAGADCDCCCWWDEWEGEGCEKNAVKTSSIEIVERDACNRCRCLYCMARLILSRLPHPLLDTLDVTFSTSVTYLVLLYMVLSLSLASFPSSLTSDLETPFDSIHIHTSAPACLDTLV